MSKHRVGLHTAAALLGVAVATTAFAEREARACGGCFAPPGPSTQVSAHRMAFAVSAKRTVLWDQIQYVGAPSNFGWVLPIRGKVDVGVSSDALFDRLEGLTTPQVTPPPPPTCPPPARRCRTSCYDAEFGAPSGAVDAATASDTGSWVDVWGTSVVGPYEATQLSASDSTALTNWLKDHGYVIPDAVGPVIDKYVSEGFGFLAIKLVPTEGTSRMVPIRIGFDGSSPSLPLRMIAAGTGAKVGIKLFVLGDGRWEAKNFANDEVRTADLVWDWRAMGSNLGPLEVSLIDKLAGKVFVTETSDDLAKTSLTAGLPAGTTTTEAGTTFSSITDETELEAAFPAKGAVRVTRLFAELPQSALGTDLELQASLGGVIPRVRQAPKGINYTCTESIEVDCPGISPVCDGSGSRDAGAGGLLGTDVPEGSAAGAGCAVGSQSDGTLGWAFGAVFGVSVFAGIRRRTRRGKLGAR